jgi:hypothetical protein
MNQDIVRLWQAGSTSHFKVQSQEMNILKIQNFFLSYLLFLCVVFRPELMLLFAISDQL